MSMRYKTTLQLKQACLPNNLQLKEALGTVRYIATVEGESGIECCEQLASSRGKTDIVYYEIHTCINWYYKQVRAQ